MLGERRFALAWAGAVFGLAVHVHGGELESRSNVVPNGYIAIDGDFADWAGVTPFTADPADIGGGQQDWQQAWIAHDDTYLYVRFERVPGSVPFNVPAGNGYRMVLDTDEDAATGLNASGPFTLPVGGEFSSSGTASVSRWGRGGACWQLGGFPFAKVSVGAPTRVEVSIPRAQILNPVTAGPATEFNIAFRGEVSSDYYPDGADSSNYFHYTTATPIAPGDRPAGMLDSLSNPVASGAIVIDGDLADWAGITPYAVDPAGDGGTGEDWVQVWIAHDDNNYYFRIERTPESLDFAAYGYWGSIDTDRNPATGILLTGATGAEYNFGGVNVINAWNPDGTFSGTAMPWGAVGIVGPVSIEASILRTTIGDPAAFNVVFLGNDSGDFYPDTAFAADYFHYIVHDPTPTGGDPVEVAVRSNQLDEGGIVIDGKFDDWAAVAPYPADAAGDNPAPGQDWVQASIAHDGNNVYFLIERGANGATFSGPFGQGYWVVLDTDRSRATGFTGFGARNFSIGGEFNWGGHATNAWGPDGCYTGGVAVQQATAAGDAEFAINRTTLLNPVTGQPATEFNFALIGENSNDLYPDSATTQVFHYTTGAVPDPLPPELAASGSNPVADGTMTIDGDLADWASVTPYPADVAGDGPGSQDWVQVWVAHDSTKFYVRLKRADGSAGWNSPGYWIAFDTDRDPATGIKLGGTNTGAEYNTGGIVGFNAWNPSGSHAGARAFAGTGEAAGTMIEVAIARSALGNPTRFRFVCVGENSGDFYPEGGHSDETFLYTFLPCHTPFADMDGDGDVDQEDFGEFQACYGGDNAPTVKGCECLDRDYGDQGDGDVDLEDLIKFINCAAGPALPPPPNCGTLP